MRSFTLCLVSFVVGFGLASGLWIPILEQHTAITKGVLEDERELLDCNVGRLESELLFERQVKLMRGEQEP